MIISLDGAWRGRPDPNKQGEKQGWFYRDNSDPDTQGWERIHVPSCWNTYPQYERYEGTFWYATDFELVPDRPEYEIETTLRFLGVNYFCQVWVNDVEIGTHEGGYLPFEFELPQEHLMAFNRLIVEVENFRAPNRIPGEVFDWFNYGGIVRDVQVHFRSPRHFRTVRITTKPMPSGTAQVSVAFQQKESFPFSWILKSNEDIVARGEVEQVGPAGNIEIPVPDARLWSPEHPNLYALELEPFPQAKANDKIVRFGIREIKTQGNRILLNGNPVKFQGVCLHEELMPFGRTIPREERFRDVRYIKELGFNAIRTAHYTHDEALIEAADEMGLLVLEEIPVYWDLDYEDKELYNKAANMIRDMINRDYNHPSVILWSVGNEIPVENPECDAFMRRLMEIARKFDGTRLVTYVSCRFLIDQTRTAADVCCLNCYVGWYFGKKEWLAKLLAMARTTAPEKPWILTEFGAGARAGFRNPHKRRFSEDFQADLLSHYIKTVNAMDWMSGWFIWLYRDFRSLLRTNRYQRGFNRKGIVSEVGDQKMICSLLGDVMNQKADLREPHVLASKLNLFRMFERFLYHVIQPHIARKQKLLFHRFYRRSPGK